MKENGSVRSEKSSPIMDCDKASACKKDQLEGVGMQNWIKIVCTLFAILFVIENYMRYGLIIGPFGIISYFCNFMKNKYKAYIWHQMVVNIWIFQCYLIEQWYLKGALQQKQRKWLHIINIPFAANVWWFMTIYFDLPPGGSHEGVTMIFFMSTKMMSYVFSNNITTANQSKKHELISNHQRQQDACDDTEKLKDIKLNGISFKRLWVYMYFVPIWNLKNINYSVGRPKYGIIMKYICKLILVYFGLTIISYQFLLPEFQVFCNHFIREQYLLCITAFIRIVIPFNLLWFLYCFYYVFCCYIPMFGAFVGMENVKLYEDWWNAEDTQMFWTKWNIVIHNLLKEIIYVPMLKRGHSKLFASLCVLIFSGIMHEYLTGIPLRVPLGFSICSMLCQIPSGKISASVCKKFGKQYGNLFVWIPLFLGFPLGGVLHYYFLYFR